MLKADGRYREPIDWSADANLGWSDALEAEWRALATSVRAGRVSRLDRGWSSVLIGVDVAPIRVRNIGADVAVGDFVVADSDGERVQTVLARRSAFPSRSPLLVRAWLRLRVSSIPGYSSGMRAVLN